MKRNKTGKKITLKRVPTGEIETITIGRALNKRGRELEEVGAEIPKECIIREAYSFDRPLFKIVKLYNGQMKKLADLQIR